MFFNCDSNTEFQRNCFPPAQKSIRKIFQINVFAVLQLKADLIVHAFNSCRDIVESTQTDSILTERQRDSGITKRISFF